MKQIKGSEKYFIDENGNVFNQKGKKLKPFSMTSKKYLEQGHCARYALDLDIGRKTLHRIVAENLVEGWFEGAFVDHIDRDPSNNHPSNLRWVTRSENRLNIDEAERTRKIKEIWRQKNANTPSKRAQRRQGMEIR